MSDETKIPLPQSLQEVVGSLLFASETPLTASELRDSVRAVETEEGDDAELMEIYRTCTVKEIGEALRGVEKALEVAGCGFRLVCTGGAYRLQTAPSCGRYVRAMLKLDRPTRLGRATLETLAIIAYRQPLTKGEIEEIRGVDVTGNIKILMDLQLIRLVGKSELPGHPFLYGTTPLFLEHFGLASLQQLNDLDPTLQRSNPKKKAAAYKKPEKKGGEGEVGVGVGGEGQEGQGQGGGGQGGEGQGESAERDADGAESSSTESAELDVSGAESSSTESAEPQATETEGTSKATDDDDDFFIDDTPDEFDEEDEEDEDDEDEEEEGDEEEDEEG